MTENQPKAVVVEYQIRKENTTVDEWLEEWEKRAEDALIGEPETNAYAAAINTEDELNILVFERYARGDHSLKAHMERPAHKTLDTVMGERKMSKRRVMSSVFPEVSGMGWWGRPQNLRQGESSNSANSQFIILGTRFETTAMREDFMALIKDHTNYCWENEPDTLVYGFGIADKDADRELDLKQGDLLCIMICTDEAAVEKHRLDPHHLALGSKCKELGIKMVNTFTRTYKLTGHGFLWR